MSLELLIAECVGLTALMDARSKALLPPLNLLYPPLLPLVVCERTTDPAGLLCGFTFFEFVLAGLGLFDRLPPEE